MFKKNFVASIKCEGKFLREKDNETFLPFGSEYSIYLKNIESRKALVSIEVDEHDILNGNKLIINGNSAMDLDCFVDELNNNRRLKFIEKTEKISKYRGDFAEDGLVIVKWQWEKEKIEIPIFQPLTYTYTHYPVTYDDSAKPLWNHTEITCCNSISPSGAFCDSELKSLNNCVNTDGITVKGSKSNQQFKYGHINTLEDNVYTITLKLNGYKSDGSEIKQGVTTKSNTICSICGISNKSISNYCRECGTYLK